MSLFENEEYRWRETYFVALDDDNRPTGDAVVETLRELNEGYQFESLRVDESGKFETVSIISPDDYAAMDVTYLTGDEVREHLEDVVEEMLPLVEGDDANRLKTLPENNARIDVFHFEQIVFAGSPDGEEEEFLDPGSLLIVLERLAQLTKGVGVDQESGTLI